MSHDRAHGARVERAIALSIGRIDASRQTAATAAILLRNVELRVYAHAKIADDGRRLGVLPRRVVDG
jgi:hypothetical protein